VVPTVLFVSCADLEFEIDFTVHRCGDVAAFLKPSSHKTAIAIAMIANQRAPLINGTLVVAPKITLQAPEWVTKAHKPQYVARALRPAAEWMCDTWDSFTANGQSRKVASATRKTRIAKV
jgi:hypothetical protein